MIQEVVKMGNQKLASPSLPITDFNDPLLKRIVEDMYDTMQEENGVGIAAPQIGHNIRMIMFGFEDNKRYPDEDSVPFTVLLNPLIEVLSDVMVDGWEGCLSVPGLRGLVPRYQSVRYRGFSLEGQPITCIAEGFHARVVQHEYDHLEGILYPKRIKNLTYFGFEDEIKNMMQSHNVSKRSS